MALGSRTRRSNNIDGRRCCECRKLAKDLVDGEYLCRIHSPMRDGFKKAIKKEKELKKKLWDKK